MRLRESILSVTRDDTVNYVKRVTEHELTLATVFGQWIVLHSMDGSTSLLVLHKTPSQMPLGRPVEKNSTCTLFVI